MSENIMNPADGKYVVIQNGERVTGALEEQQAIAEAERRKQLIEAQGSLNPPTVQVKQNLFG